jgi:methionine-S-sulfoxide reductase
MQITLGGGCFWCIEAALKEIDGVEALVNGYAGGSVAAPTYEAVCGGDTGHAEVVRVTFDEIILPLEDLLRVFFSVHNPTTLNRQGADTGTQYRSAIFTEGSEQAARVTSVIAEVQEFWTDPIITDVQPLAKFWPGEEYHQDYYARNPEQGYCAAVISPKLTKLRKKWAHRIKAPAE